MPDDNKSRLCYYDAQIISENNLSCKEFKNVPNGFYWNGFYYKYVIACDGTKCDDIFINKDCVDSSVNSVSDNIYNIGFCKDSQSLIPLIPGSEITFSYKPESRDVFSNILGKDYILKTKSLAIKTTNYSSVISKYILFNIKLKIEKKSKI